MDGQRLEPGIRGGLVVGLALICEVGGAQIFVDLGGGGFRGGLVVGWALICEVGGAQILVDLGGGDV